MLSKFRSLATVSVLSVGSLLAACSHDKDAPEPALGALTGQVSVLDETGQPAAAGGVTVSVGSGAQQRTATTDAAGSFSLAGLPTAKYTMVFTRADIGTFYEPVELNEQQRSVTRNVQLGQTSSTRINSLTYRGVSTIGSAQVVEIEQNVTYNAQLYPQGYFVNTYFGDAPTVSASNYKLKFGGGSNVNPARSIYSVSALRQAGFASGATVYAIAYGAAKMEIAYEAPVPANAPQRITANLNAVPSNVVSFTMP